MAALKAKIEVGTSLRQALAEVGTAWKAAVAGQPVEASDTLCFVDWEALVAVLTPKRFDLIRHLRREPADSIRALARALKRDYKNVHADVMALEALGLIRRDPDSGKITAELDQVASIIKFAA